MNEQDIGRHELGFIKTCLLKVKRVRMSDHCVEKLILVIETGPLVWGDPKGEESIASLREEKGLILCV